jgi:uncharacterized protein (TIGR03437 family)
MRLIPTSLLAVAISFMPAYAAAPTIRGVINAASYQPGAASATWIAITGSNLASSSRAWAGGDFVSGNLPTKLDDVSVTINGKAAYVYFISAGQINVLAPDDPATGSVPVQVTNAQGTSNTVSVNKTPVFPALFNYSQLGGIYSVIQAAATYELIAPPATFGQTVRTVPAAPGENLILYATGLGPVASGQPTGQLVQTPSATTNPVTVLIGNVKAPVQFAGLIGSGLYQVNVTVPQLPSGDAPIVLSVNGVASSGPAFVPIQAPPGPVGGQTAPAISGCVTGPVDYITYSVGLLSFNRPDELSIGGTRMCSTCTIKSPLYPEFSSRMEKSMGQKKNVQACYDARGNVVQVTLVRP